MKRVIKASLVAAGFFLGLLPANQASAFAYRLCNGNVVKWGSDFLMERNSCTMPGGSAWAGAFDMGIWQWSKVNNKMQGGIFSGGCQITHGNGRNGTILVNRSTISGNSGLTVLQLTPCVLSSSISEADVMIANDLDPFPDDESFWGWTHLGQGEGVLMHEFGHALGLTHSNSFMNLMHTSGPIPLSGHPQALSYAQPYGDDANGIRFLYGGSSTNLFASAQKMLGTSIVATTSTVASNPSHNCVTMSGPGFCRGQTIGIDATFANNGSSNKTIVGRMYISQSVLPGSGWTMWQGNMTVNAGNQFTQLFWVPIPTAAPLGFHWIHWQIDQGGAVTEYNEQDNHVHSCMTLNITC